MPPAYLFFFYFKVSQMYVVLVLKMVLWDVPEIPREIRLGTPEKNALLAIPEALSDAPQF